MTLIRSVSGIRGLVGTDLTCESVSHFAKAFSDFIGKGKILGGRDTRISGSIFSDIFAKTANFNGIGVSLIGIVPTPTVLFLVRKHKYDGGFIITASHNPPEYNGIKLVNAKGRFLNSDDYKSFLNLESNPPTYKESEGSIKFLDDMYNEHIDAVLKLPFVNTGKIKRRKLKVVFDGGSGGGSIVISKMLEMLKVDLTVINTNIDGKFNRPLEPIPANLSGLAKAVKKHNADIGLATDGDGDRIAIVTQKRGAVSEEYTLAMTASYALSKYNSHITVINQSTSMMLELLGKQKGFKVFRTPVGEANVVDGILKFKAVIGGEGNGGVILPELNYTRDALVASALLVMLLTESGKSADDIIDDMPVLFMEKRKYEITSSAVIKRFLKIFKQIPFTCNDGMRFDFGDGFLHIRKSGTEPIMRIIAEFKSKERLTETFKQIERIL